MQSRLLSFATLTVVVACGGMISNAAAAPDDTKPSVTAFPVVASPNRFPDEIAKRVGTVVATLLEKAGLEELEVADTMFAPPESDDVSEIAKAFGKHVGANAIETDYAVLAQFVGSPQAGVQEIQTIVVDRTGQVLLADAADKAELDKAPLRPKDPMTCCVFVSGRLQKFWQLADPMRPNAPEGKMTEFWRKDAGIPSKEELDAMRKRAKTLKGEIKTASCTVYPLRIGGKSDSVATADLVASLNKAGLGKVQASETDPELKITPHSNEQKVLWNTARAFQKFVKENQPTTDYAVFADHGLSGERVHYVHVVLCTRSAQWVMVDFQNSHHTSFQEIDPKSAADCNRLLLARLKAWLDE